MANREKAKDLFRKYLKKHETNIYMVKPIHCVSAIDAIEQALDISTAINWVAVLDKLPSRTDEDYLVVVRNKNKEGGIPLIDIGNFSSDGIWIKANTWEDVVYWAELPETPCL